MQAGGASPRQLVGFEVTLAWRNLGDILLEMVLVLLELIPQCFTSSFYNLAHSRETDMPHKTLLEQSGLGSSSFSWPMPQLYFSQAHMKSVLMHVTASSGQGRVCWDMLLCQLPFIFSAGQHHGMLALPHNLPTCTNQVDKRGSLATNRCL